MKKKLLCCLVVVMVCSFGLDSAYAFRRDVETIADAGPSYRDMDAYEDVRFTFSGRVIDPLSELSFFVDYSDQSPRTIREHFILYFTKNRSWSHDYENVLNAKPFDQSSEDWVQAREKAVKYQIVKAVLMKRGNLSKWKMFFYYTTKDNIAITVKTRRAPPHGGVWHGVEQNKQGDYKESVFKPRIGG